MLLLLWRALHWAKMSRFGGDMFPRKTDNGDIGLKEVYLHGEERVRVGVGGWDGQSETTFSFRHLPQLKGGTDLCLKQNSGSGAGGSFMLIGEGLAEAGYSEPSMRSPGVLGDESRPKGLELLQQLSTQEPELGRKLPIHHFTETRLPESSLPSRRMRRALLSYRRGEHALSEHCLVRQRASPRVFTPESL